MSGMRRDLLGPYPRGVPSPRTVHVHPYPTRYHGSINTRPMFSMPFQWAPHAVFKPDDFNREGPMQGLGTLQYNTGRGIFLPQGYGGGIFDENLSGLGYTSESIPWMTYSADTLQFQKDLNNLLRAAGKPTISEDGKLGKNTCNACRGIDACRPVPKSCDQQYAQTSSPAPLPAPPLPSAESSMLPSPGGGLSRSTKNAMIFVGAGAAAIGAVYLFSRARRR